MTRRQRIFRHHTSLTWTCVAVALILSACSSSAPVVQNNSNPAGGVGTSIPTFTSDSSKQKTAAELEELFWARTDSSRMRFTPADVDFMTGMIAHHAQALIMSDMAESHGAGSELQVLTARIINAQKDEIATMQSWLKDRGQTVPEVHIDGLKLMMHGVADHHAHMPGMLTEDQLRRLDEARGQEWERLFLEFMIQHHQGAVGMVEDLFRQDGAAQDDLAFKVATDIQVDQRTEIARMELMLEKRGGPVRKP